MSISIPPAQRPARCDLDRFGRVWAVLPWGMMAAAAVAAVGLASVVGPDWSEPVAAWPFLLSAVVLGMPHGALDLRLALRVNKRWNRRAALATGYLAIAGISFALLWLLPLVAIAAFGVLTVMHFGAADARDGAMIAGHRPPRGGPLWVTAAGRGTFFLSLPFAWDPGGAMLPVEVALQLVGAEGVAYADVAVRSGGTVAAGVGLLAVVAGVVLTWQRAARAHPAEHGNVTGSDAADSQTGDFSPNNEKLLTTHIGELAVLAVAASMLEPMFFVGLYFLGWHSVRHLRRAAVLSGDAAGRPVRTFVRQHLWSLPLLLPTLAVYAVIGHAWIGWADPMSWAVLLLLAFVVLTPPHHLLVERAIQVCREP
ncbi:MAG: Brp/Blh family beta-carotene 15,15'-dioxygenase [Phycisphaeraceae bacterium]